jgi:thioredoxin 1
MLAAVLSLGFVGLMVLMQVAIRRRAAAMQGTKLPVLPGALGAQVSSAPDALVYFFSPTCGACRAITPRVRALQEHNPRVFAVDITQDLELARALNVMATPSTVEVREGTIAGYHVGPIPEAVYARFK